MVALNDAQQGRCRVQFSEASHALQDLGRLIPATSSAMPAWQGLRVLQVYAARRSECTRNGSLTAGLSSLN